MNPTKLRRDAETAARAARLEYSAEALTAIRNRHGRTQEEWAPMLRVSVRTLLRWEAEGLANGPAALLYELVETGVWEPSF